MPDSADWLHRLRIVGIDLRNPGQVVALADSVAEQGPLDILINNAAQTVRRSPGCLRAAGRGGGGRPPRRARPGGADDRPGERRRAARRAARRPRRRSPLVADPGCARRPGAQRRLGVAGPDRRPDRDRRRRPGPGPRSGQQLDPAGGRGRSGRDARGAALQLDRAVHPGRPACARPSPPPPRAASTSSTSRRWRASSVAATRAPDTRTRTWRRRRVNMLTRTSAEEMLATDGILVQQRRHRLDHRRASPSDEDAPRRRGLPRSARSRRRGGARLRPDRARRGRRGSLRLLPEGLRAGPLVRGGRAAPGQRPEGT